LRRANQGFFDVAVNFDDIFCSAKVDCPSRLLHNPNTDLREATAVVALACTSGEGSPTYLHASDLTLTCTGETNLEYALANTTAVGQHGPVATDSGNAGVYQWATYQGREFVDAEGSSIEKCYWNRAVGLDLAALATLGADTCTISGIATATQSPDVTSAIGGPGTSYPIIRWSADVLTGGATLCQNNPLDGAGSGVTTDYVTASTDPMTLPRFSRTYTCGAAAPSPTIACGQSANVSQLGANVTIQSAGGSLTFAMPDGLELGTSCCVDGCCAEP